MGDAIRFRQINDLDNPGPGARVVCVRFGAGDSAAGFQPVYAAARLAGVPAATYVRLRAIAAARADWLRATSEPARFPRRVNVRFGPPGSPDAYGHVQWAARWAGLTPATYLRERALAAAREDLRQAGGGPRHP